MKKVKNLFELPPIPNYIYDKRGRTEVEKTHKHKKGLYLKILIIVGLPLIALLTTSFLVRLYHVDGPSMEPTLNSGERVLVQKLSKTRASISGDPYAPNRYDIVVVKPPAGGKQVIKRVIGLPGDRVVIVGGGVVVINDQYPEGYRVDGKAPGGELRFIETTSGDVDVELGRDEYYVLGDNRAISEDSREFGPVLSENIVGKLWKRL